MRYLAIAASWVFALWITYVFDHGWWAAIGAMAVTIILAKPKRRTASTPAGVGTEPLLDEKELPVWGKDPKHSSSHHNRAKPARNDPASIIPRYFTDKSDLLHIKDISNPGELFAGMDKEERNSYTIERFDEWDALYYFEFDITPDDPIDAIDEKYLLDNHLAADKDEAREIMKAIEAYRYEDIQPFTVSPPAKPYGYLQYDVPDDPGEFLEYMTVNDLKEILRERRLKVSGRKDELIQRIVENDAAPKTLKRVSLNRQKTRQKLAEIAEVLDQDIFGLVRDWHPCAIAEVYDTISSEIPEVDDFIKRRRDQWRKRCQR